jgi:hypothetical protein
VALRSLFALPNGFGDPVGACVVIRSALIATPQ